MSIGAETRLIQVGESAAPVISLPAAVLRSRALTIRGTAGIPPRDALTTAMNQVLDCAAAGSLTSKLKPSRSPKSSKLGRAPNVPAASLSSPEGFDFNFRASLSH